MSGEIINTVIGEREIPDLCGKLLPRRYLVLEHINEGGFCFVWLTYRLRDSTFWAVKMFHQDETSTAKKEKRIMEKLGQLPGFIHLEEYFWYEDCLTLVYPLYGLPLADSNSGVGVANEYFIDYLTIESFARQIQTAVELLFTTKFMIHSDIKPENVLIKEPCHEHRQIISTFLSINPQEIYRQAIDGKKGKKALKAAKKVSKLLYQMYSKKEKLEIPELEINQDTEVIIIDLGNAFSLARQEVDIQTRYYQAPEILLDLKYTHKCEYWSIGCLLYEIATTELLFDPILDKGKKYHDCHHLYLMQNLLGKMPQNMIDCSDKKNRLYQKNGLVKNFEEQVPESLNEKILNNLEKDRDDFDIIASKLPVLINKYLQMEPGNRVGISIN